MGGADLCSVPYNSEDLIGCYVYLVATHVLVYMYMYYVHVTIRTLNDKAEAQPEVERHMS